MITNQLKVRMRKELIVTLPKTRRATQKKRTKRKSGHLILVFRQVSNPHLESLGSY
jgi:hypothetical protein